MIINEKTKKDSNSRVMIYQDQLSKLRKLKLVKKKDMKEIVNELIDKEYERVKEEAKKE